MNYSIKDRKRLGGLFIILGCVFLIGAIVMICRLTQYNKRCTEEVLGVVTQIDSEYKSGKNSHYEYTPHVRYVFDNIEYSYTSRISFKNDSFYDGQSIIVMVDPADPEFCFLKEEKTPTVKKTLLFFVGFISMVAVGAGNRKISNNYLGSGGSYV